MTERDFPTNTCPRCGKSMGLSHICGLEQDVEIKPDEAKYTHIRRDKSGNLWHMRHYPNCNWFTGSCTCGADAINEQIDLMCERDTMEDVEIKPMEVQTPSGRDSIRHGLQGATRDNYYYKLLVDACGLLDKQTEQLSYQAKEIDSYTKSNIDLMCERDTIEDALRQIDNWAKAYPLEAYPKPDLDHARVVLKANGMTLDSIRADSMRHVLDGIKGIVEKALKGA